MYLESNAASQHGETKHAYDRRQVKAKDEVSLSLKIRSARKLWYLPFNIPSNRFVGNIDKIHCITYPQTTYNHSKFYDFDRRAVFKRA